MNNNRDIDVRDAKTQVKSETIILDEKVIAALPGGAVMLPRILMLFLKNSEELVLMMEAGIQQDDAGQVQRAAHTLKSSSAMVGATALSELCITIEAISVQDELTGVASMVEKLREIRALVECECQASYLK